MTLETIAPYLAAVPLLLHGLAHLSGVFAPWTKSMQGFANSAWLFSRSVTLTSAAGKAFSLVWLAAAACLALAGAGILLQWGSWATFAVTGSLLSLGAILPWWRAVPPGAKAGAAFDLLTLAALLSPLRETVKRWVG